MANNYHETLIVHGMSCTGCEAVIEETLLELEGILEAKASFAKNMVKVVYNPTQIGFEKMRTALLQAGYQIEKSQDKKAKKPESNTDKPFTSVQFIGIAVVLLAIYLIINHTIGFNFIPEVTSSMGYGVLFVVGLLTSLHCVAMCGGINLSQCVSSNGIDTGTAAKLKPSLFYNLGRVTSYTMIGGIIGALGSVISFSGRAQGLVAILSGVFMVIMGISMTGLLPGLNRITPRLPRIFREKADSAKRGKGAFMVGLLNGFMPCGPLQVMQVYALGTGSFISGALSMFFFSLGTLPLMFGLGAMVTMLGSKFSKKMMKISAVLVVVLGIIMLSRGLALSGVSLPSLTSATTASTAALTTTAVPAADGVQNITSTLTSRGYPNITVKKGVPVVWNLQAASNVINGCNQTLVLSKFGLRVNLQAGDNIIQFTPTQSGTIQYSCWMGMQTGKITVVD